MKNLITISASLLCGINLLAADVEKEYDLIEPLRSSTISFTGEYEINRRFHGFADKNLRHGIERRFDGTLSFEKGWGNYVNGGVLVGFGISDFAKPLHVRTGIFLRPYFPLGERFALFTRVSTGLGVDFAFNPSAKDYYGSFDDGENFEHVYKGQKYVGLPFGGFGAASLGLDFFPFARFGVGIEWGIRATLMYGTKNLLFAHKVEEKSGAPNSFSFMLYELPIMLSFHVVI